MKAPYFYRIKEGPRAHDCWLIFIYSDIDILLKKSNGFRTVNDLRKRLLKIYIIHNYPIFTQMFWIRRLYPVTFFSHSSAMDTASEVTNNARKSGIKCPKE